MAKYSAFKYSTAKYGTSAAGAQPTYTGAYLYVLNIRWSGDWVNEAGRLMDASGNRGRQFYVGQSGERFENIQPGEFTFVLDNHDLRYDPYNASGALYGQIEPGKAVQFTAIYLSTGTRYRIFTGHIKDIRPTSGRNQVQIIVTDDLQWLADQDITIPTAYQVTVDQAINKTLDAASYPYSRSIATSACPITFFDPQEANALDTIRDLADAGLGTVFVDAYGRLKYYDRTTTGQPTTILDQAVLLKEITITQPWDTVRNKITCIANRYGYGAAEVLWRLDDVWGFPEGAATSFKIEFPSGKVIQPVPGTDYTSSETIGTLIPYVGYINVAPLFSVWLSNITTTSCTVTVRNNETSYQYLRFLQIRGTPLVNKKISFDVSDGASVAKGPRRMRIDTPWLQDRGFAQAYATLLLAHLKSPSKDPVITMETRTDGLAIDLLDRINVTSAKLGIDVTYDVGYIEYKWLEPTGQGFTQTFHLQNVLYSTSSITPQPYYPTEPPIPPERPPMPPVPPPPTTGSTPDCILTYPALVKETGPFTVNGGVIDNASPSVGFPTGYWFRASQHQYRTFIDVDAIWEKQTAGIWSKDNTYDFIAVEGVDIRNIIRGYGSIVGEQVVDGVRRYQFDNSQPFYCERVIFRLETDDIVTEYSVTGTVLSGTINANSLPAIEIPGFTVGTWYAVENSGGPFGTLPNKGYSTALTKSSPYASPYVASLGAGYDGINNYVPDNEGTFGEAVSAVYGRVYFRAVQTSYFYRIRETESVIPSTAGTIGYVISSASVPGGERRVTVRSIKIYNVCIDDGTLPR